MRPAHALWAYLLFVFIGAAILAPWVYDGLQGLASHGEFWAKLSKAPFRRVVNRCLLVLALAGIWPLIKGLGVHSWSEMGLHRSRPILRDVAEGLLIGALLMGLAAFCSLAVGAAAWDHNANIGKHLGGIIATAVIVSIIEEILFRGAIYTALRKSSPEISALLASSAIYAITHFFARPEDPASIHWYSGFQILGGMLAGFSDLVKIFPGFLSLTLLGMMLALAMKRTGALYLSIGLHASLVFGSRLYAVTTEQLSTGNSWFWGTKNLIDGWFCFVLLAIATFLFLRKAPEPAPARA